LVRSVRRSRLAVPILAVLTAALAFVPTAPATFPGANGNIAFTSERNGNPEIYTVPPGGGVQTRRTELASDDNAPAWNAAGTEIAFSSNRGVDSLGDFEIYRMLADGTNVSAVTTNTVDDSSPAWAPGGAELVVVRHELGDTELVIVPADGSGAGTSLTGPIASISGPVEPD
jgi:TolB protein